MVRAIHTGTLFLANILTQRILWWLFLATGLGVLLPTAAHTLAVAVPFILAVMIGGLGVTLPLNQLGKSFLCPRFLALAIGSQIISTPLVGFLLWRVYGSQPSWAGLLVQAVSPSEITSPLMTQIAQGSLVAAMPAMFTSLLLAPIIMPLLLRFSLGQAVPVPAAAMFRSLLLTVALPLLLGSTINTAFHNPKTVRQVGPGIAALMVVVLIFIVVGNATEEINASSWSRLLMMIAASLVLVGAGVLLGWLAAALFKLDQPTSRALVFTTGMREFGVASAVSLAFFDAQTALFPAIYGVVMMLTTAWIARILRRRDMRQVPSPGTF